MVAKFKKNILNIIVSSYKWKLFDKKIKAFKKKKKTQVPELPESMQRIRTRAILYFTRDNATGSCHIPRRGESVVFLVLSNASSQFPALLT